MLSLHENGTNSLPFSGAKIHIFFDTEPLFANYS